MKRIRHHSKAFSTLEFLLIATIIGLTFAAILEVRRLMHQADIRNTVADFSKYSNAISLFNKQYDSLPGDTDKAHDFFGGACDLSAVNCNGDGDGRVEESSNNQNNEVARAWQHLSLSKYVEQIYTGIGSDSEISYGVNTPASPIKGGYHIYGINGVINDLQFPRRNVIMLSDANSYWGGVFVPQYARELDLKMDDGLPYGGNLVIQNSVWLDKGKNCYKGEISYNASYDIESDSETCSMIYLLEYAF